MNAYMTAQSVRPDGVGRTLSARGAEEQDGRVGDVDVLPVRNALETAHGKLLGDANPGLLQIAEDGETADRARDAGVPSLRFAGPAWAGVEDAQAAEGELVWICQPCPRSECSRWRPNLRRRSSPVGA